MNAVTEYFWSIVMTIGKWYLFYYVKIRSDTNRAPDLRMCELDAVAEEDAVKGGLRTFIEIQAENPSFEYSGPFIAVPCSLGLKAYQ